MAGKKDAGKVTTAPAVAFEKDGKKFVTFIGPGCSTVEVYDSKAFQAEFGITFQEFCEKQDREEDKEAR